MRTMMSSSDGAINVTRSVVQREGGLRNSTNMDFRLSRLRSYNHPIVARDGRHFRQLIQHPKLYRNRRYNCKFSECAPVDDTVATSRADGYLTLLNSYGVDLLDGKERLQSINVEYNSIVDFAWMPNELNLVSGAANGQLSLWQINGLHTGPIANFYGHIYAIKSVCFSKHQTRMFASGGEVGEVNVFDLRSTAFPIFWINSAHDDVDDALYNLDKELCYHEGTSITGLVFQNEHTLLSCTFGKRIIKAWDLRQLKTGSDDEPEHKYSLLLEPNASDVFHGFTSLSIDPTGKKLYARCSNQTIYGYDVSTPESYFPVEEYTTNDVDKIDYFDSITTKAKLNPDGKYLISSSNNDTAYIWNTNGPGKPVAKLTSPGNVIKSVDWGRTSYTKIAMYMEKNYVQLWQDETETNIRIKQGWKYS